MSSSLSSNGGGIDDSFVLSCLLIGGDGPLDESFELDTVSGVGAGATDGFFVATNSEINVKGAAGTLDGYKEKTLMSIIHQLPMGEKKITELETPFQYLFLHMNKNLFIPYCGFAFCQRFNGCCCRFTGRR